MFSKHILYIVDLFLYQYIRLNDVIFQIVRYCYLPLPAMSLKIQCYPQCIVDEGEHGEKEDENE